MNFLFLVTWTVCSVKTPNIAPRHVTCEKEVQNYTELTEAKRQRKIIIDRYIFDSDGPALVGDVEIFKTGPIEKIPAEGLK